MKFLKDLIEKINQRFTKRLRIVSAAGAAACGCLALNAGAQQIQSFNTTNILAPSVQLNTWPTNVLGTNAAGASVGQGTGGAIGVQNQQECGITVSGYAIITNGPIGLGFQVVRANTASSPTAYSNWETTATSAGTIVFTLPTMNGPFTWTTNLDHNFIIPATHIGIANLTNNLQGTDSIPVFTIIPGKKIIPIRYP